MKRQIASAIVALLVAGATLAAASSVSSPKPVFRVDSASAAAQPGSPNRLVIQAQGAVRSGGWENARLRVKEIPSNKPNTLIIVFVAIPPKPSEMVVQSVLPVQATVTVPMPKASITEVQIAGETNTITAKILR